MKFNIDKLLKLLRADTNDILSNPIGISTWIEGLKF